MVGPEGSGKSTVISHLLLHRTDQLNVDGAAGERVDVHGQPATCNVHVDASYGRAYELDSAGDVLVVEVPNTDDVTDEVR